MSPTIPLIVAAVVVALIVWRIMAARAKSQAAREALEQFGFHPCPDKQAWIAETVARLENDRRYTYTVSDPMRLEGEPAVYCYAKTRTRNDSDVNDNAMGAHEVLFPLKRQSSDRLMMLVKPSALKSGFATDAIALVAAGPWAAQSDDFQKIEIPIELVNSNLVAVFGPRAGILTELLDAKALGVLKDIGDAGGMFVLCRDGWCSIAGMSKKDFRTQEIVNRIRPLVRP